MENIDILLSKWMWILLGVLCIWSSVYLPRSHKLVFGCCKKQKLKVLLGKNWKQKKYRDFFILKIIHLIISRLKRWSLIPTWKGKILSIYLNYHYLRNHKWLSETEHTILKVTWPQKYKFAVISATVANFFLSFLSLKKPNLLNYIIKYAW